MSLEVFTAVTATNAFFWDVASWVLLRTDVSEVFTASIFKVERNSEVGTTLTLTSRSVLDFNRDSNENWNTDWCDMLCACSTIIRIY
jgi:hypothetical protein